MRNTPLAVWMVDDGHTEEVRLPFLKLRYFWDFGPKASGPHLPSSTPGFSLANTDLQFAIP